MNAEVHLFGFVKIKLWIWEIEIIKLLWVVVMVGNY